MSGTISNGIKGATAAILLILGAIFAAEGGYVNDPRDPGGETNHGITKRVAVANGYDGAMKALPMHRAAEIYISQYIDKPGFRAVIDLDAAVGEELVDSGVNLGPARPSRWFQQSLNALNNRGTDYPDVKVDGRVGVGTAAAFKALQGRRGKTIACRLVLRLMDAQQAVEYMRLGGTNGSLEVYSVGWVRTRVRNVDEAKCLKAAA